jgi:PAS domain S-box-containing protein
MTAVLLVAGMVPATALLVAESRENFAHVRAATRSEVEAIASLVAEQHQRAVDTVRGTLLATSRLPSLRAGDAKGCSAALGSIASATDLYVNLSASSPDGRMFCSANPMKVPVSLADRAFFRNVLRTGDFSGGPLVVTRLRAMAAVGFGFPVRDDAGALVAVASATLRVDTLQRQLDALTLPPRVAVEVVDREGRVVTVREERGAAEEEPFGPEIVKLAMGRRAVHEGPGRDGIRRLFAFQRVEATDGPVLWVMAAVPTDVVEAPVREAARRTLTTWLIAMVAVALGAGFVAEFLLIRRFRAIARAAARIAGGDYGARTGLSRSRDELGDLVDTFDEMARSLEELQRQNRLLLDSIGDGIVGLDGGTLVVFANPAAAKLLGVPVEEMKGRSFASLARHAGPRGDPCLVRQSLEDGQVHVAAEDTFTRLDGASFPVESVTTPVVDGGKIVGAVVALRDATERRRLEEQLRQAQKMEAVGQLAGGVAHDFNNLLTAIITCGRMIQESLAPNHPAQPDVAEILSSGDRAAQLTRQLLAFARRQRLAPRPIDLRESVAGIERMLRRVLGETIALVVELPKEPVVVHADPGQLELVVLNLAVNSRDAMPSGGELRISVGVVEMGEPADADEGGATGPMAQLSVRDTGVGMDGETQDRIFEPFFTTKPSGKGTGLGLATVYGIVKQSDGFIRVRSERGNGTEFRVLFPLNPGVPAAQPLVPEAVVGGSERVLVLEDDDVLRTLVCRALVGGGYRVAEASRPSAVRERVGQEELDLLVTDLVLPEQSGWQLYKEMVARRPGLRVLIMSGFASEPVAGLAALPADVPFLAKPFAPRELLLRVRQALDGPPPAV